MGHVHNLTKRLASLQSYAALNSVTHNTCLGGRERKSDPPAGLTRSGVCRRPTIRKERKEWGRGLKLRHRGENKDTERNIYKTGKTKISSQITFNSILKANDSAEKGTWQPCLLVYLATYKTGAGIYYVSDKGGSAPSNRWPTTLNSMTVKAKRLCFPQREQRYKVQSRIRLALPSLTLPEVGRFIDQITDCGITSHSILPQTPPLKRTLPLSL